MPTQTIGVSEAANATRPVLREDRQVPTDMDDASQVTPPGFLPHRNVLRLALSSMSLMPPALAEEAACTPRGSDTWESSDG